MNDVNIINILKGLYHDDIYMTSFPEYHEALRRLPPNLYDEFNFRAIRACQLDINKDYLPVNQRPTYEEDITKGRYLKPYLDEVLAEKKEKEEWEKFMAK